MNVETSLEAMLFQSKMTVYGKKIPDRNTEFRESPH